MSECFRCFLHLLRIGQAIILTIKVSLCLSVRYTGKPRESGKARSHLGKKHFWQATLWVFFTRSNQPSRDNCCCRGHTIRYDTRCYFNVRSKADISQLNPWPTFSPYLYNRVWSELTCCNSLSHSRLACSRLSAHIEPSVNNPRRQTRPILRHGLS